MVYSARHHLFVAGIPDARNSIAYNCHGSMVYITQLQHLLLTWTVPAMFLIGFVAMAIDKREKSLNARKG